MKIKNLQDLEVFVAAAEHGGLSAAARVLDLSPAVASVALKRLERDLRASLFLRTTRSMRLTLDGERLLERARPLLDSLRAAEEEIASGHAVLEGQLQISMPSDIGRHLFVPWLDEFQSAWPGVRLRLQLADRLADMYREPVDVAIRYGHQPDSGMVAFPLLTANPRVLCAAPSYIARHGRPASPAQLAEHNCLCFMLDGEVYERWRFRKGGNDIQVHVAGNRVADDSEVVRRWAVEGHGIAYRARADIFDDLAAGRLLPLCEDWEGDNVPLYFVVAGRRQISPLVRLLREFLLARCGRFGIAGGRPRR
ncbi:LysR family transcriptional regulator [Noviherbaspirillum aridicola]|uniref:LysR family transcriptional regulator n=1 Tax=Noviherbaspirillum aridicola TaxID=2849687 RepID=UPI00283A9CED|nr:LysR family transcriptional regulator [Noviherbaspirillum aridicola]